MAKIYEQREHKVIDESRDYKTVTATMGAETSVCSIKCKSGAAAKLVKVGNAVGAGGENYLTFTLYINGIPCPDYQNFNNMITDPANPEAQLSSEIPLQQAVTIELKVVNSDAGNDYSATGCLVVYYEDPS